MAAGSTTGSLRVAGIIVAPVDRVLVDALEQQARDVGHPRFGVAIGGGAVAVDIAEIALPLDQRIARGKILREAHQRVIDRLVAMRMERAHHVADDLGAFLERRAGIEPQDVHAVEDAPMHRLQPVARVRQRPAHDGRQRIGEIALFERVAQIDVDRRRGGGGGEERLWPWAGLAEGVSRGKRRIATAMTGRRSTPARVAICERWWPQPTFHPFSGCAPTVCSF